MENLSSENPALFASLLLKVKCHGSPLVKQAQELLKKSETTEALTAEATSMTDQFKKWGDGDCSVEANWPTMLKPIRKAIDLHTSLPEDARSSMTVDVMAHSSAFLVKIGANMISKWIHGLADSDPREWHAQDLTSLTDCFAKLRVLGSKLEVPEEFNASVQFFFDFCSKLQLIPKAFAQADTPAADGMDGATLATLSCIMDVASQEPVRVRVLSQDQFLRVQAGQVVCVLSSPFLFSILAHIFPSPPRGDPPSPVAGSLFWRFTFGSQGRAVSLPFAPPPQGKVRDLVPPGVRAPFVA